ncbi:hypothetical protein ODZ84_22600 [Chryseobacterium fluminis]|uniref:hypothetical protein n=1 Tax=Chryseobacterium fluminis TaxID=2983606 RepID=UPI002254DDA7|nr:hypothetical protein [Chryseobacterium sp. MMS21-Ot14]UZT97923.1 hypothetical protein ODZ84_22600 [Chryseobacterium sp. MMS21-Ot14]
MINNKQIKIISIILGLLLLMAGVVLIVSKPNIFIAYPIALMGTGGYLFAVGSASILLTKMYYNDISVASAQRNKFIRMIEIFTYSIMGVIMLTTIIICFALL